jgi:hypothetical protein
LADKISGYQSNRNCLTEYGATPMDCSDYDSPIGFFMKMVEYMEDLELMVGEAISLADNDAVTIAFLNNFILDLIPITNQCLLLLDKAEEYKDNWMAFDRGISNFMVI